MKEYWKRGSAVLLAGVMMAGLLSGCGNEPTAEKTEADGQDVYIDEVVLQNVNLENEMVALAGNGKSAKSTKGNGKTKKTTETAPPVEEQTPAPEQQPTTPEQNPAEQPVPTPAVPLDYTPVASGTLVKQDASGVIDYSNTKDGYVMVRYQAASGTTLKVQVTGPSGVVYTNNMASDVWTTFSLSDGNGTYKVVVYKSTKNGKYATMLSVSFPVSLVDEFAPFLRPNPYVNFTAAPNTVAKAAQLTAGKTSTLDKVGVIYNYVVDNLTYDYDFAKVVPSGYRPNLDQVLAKQKGICSDYASLMAGMLRSQGIPCKFVVGYVPAGCHAWLSVWTAEQGWIDNMIYFDGTSWKRMDPTFASTGHKSATRMQYIENDSNYTEKYFY